MVFLACSTNLLVKVLLTSIFAFATSGDSDFDGVPYGPNWPDGSSAHPAPLSIVAGGPFSLTSSGFTNQFANVQFETNVPYTESSCNVFTGVGCTVPPSQAAFYPFYSKAVIGAACLMNFGNDIAGLTTNDFGKDAQYGSSNPSQPALFTSAVQKNPCAP